ncbi:MAG: class I SAM-dependent methyltransferase, partial [Chloroflexota bacterium]|nr:class I SAM-dependent methyltransferase [Chloroflexota bacterium]
MPFINRHSWYRDAISWPFEYILLAPALSNDEPRCHSFRVTWEEVFVRQQQRAFLLPAWFEGLHLKADDHVLDIGAGPGYVSGEIASLVGPRGLVYALDRESEPLAYLREVLQRQQMPNIRCIVADVLSLHLEDEQISAVLLSMMLHHSDNPAALIGKLTSLIPSDGWAVIAEFHPDGPGYSGPPRNTR